ncbi:MAG: bifunctional DNA-formamidopyrimidine glycosylase/DNA-(apurinic or apyrimidinic site) lyase [Dehalococcoidia bacterium]|jgi:formamidopyrimidine-DNA glycosylase
MPELPEVETIKNSLEPHLVGRTFTGVKIDDTRPLQNLKAGEFRRRLIGKTVRSLKRRGKYMIFGLSGGEDLIIHLRMTGALLWNPQGEEPFARIEFSFDNGGRLLYTDVRRFGTMYLVNDASSIIGKLGIEPLGDRFTAVYLAGILNSHPTPVKSLLLDQERIAGIGNMYADEALFHARLHPLRPGNSLDKAEITRLHRGIRFVLEKGIRNRGASIRNYRCPDGQTGTAHEEFAVAHREGQSCPRCGGKIARMVVGQRGTYYCPKCQPLNNNSKGTTR